MTQSNIRMIFFKRSMVLVLGLAIAGSAYAQQDIRRENVSAIEEITVTAQKREQNLQDVPMAISAFSSDFIEEARIEGFADLATRVPGFTFSNFSKVRTFPALRGASSSIDEPGGDQAVAIFVDEVFYGGIGDFDPFMFDLERIEVLRGPQGTLFGRNVVGGAISIITRKPSQEPYAKAEGGFGNHDYINGDMAIGGPLTDTISGQIAFSTRKSDGYSENRTTGQDVDNIDKSSVRARIRFQPSDTFDAMIGGEMFRDTSSGEARDFIGPPPSIPETNGWIPDPDPYVVDQSIDGSIDRTTAGLSAHLSWQFDAGQLKSISAYRKNDSVLLGADALGAVVPTFNGDYFAELDQFSQEIRFESTPGNGPLDWVAGVYYLDLDNQKLEELTISMYPGTQFGDIQLDLYGGTLGQFPGGYFMKVKTESLAAYLDGTYRFNDVLSLSLGGRYTSDEKSGVGNLNLDRPNLFLGEDPYSTSFGETWNSFTPRVSLTYAASDDAMMYATVSQGFKSGGFGIQDNAEGTQTPYNQEEAINYELGLKSQWFDDRLRVNLTAFSVDYTDLQVGTTLSNGITIIANAGEASADGFEVEVDAVPIDNWRVWGSYSYLDTVYDSFGDFTGAQLALAPPRAYSLGSSYTWDLTASSYATFSADVQHKAEHDLEPRPVGANEEAFRTGFDSIVNANLTFGIEDGKWEVVLWGKNLTNENYVVYGQDLRGFVYTDAELASIPAIQTANFPRYNQPRTFGVSFRWRL